MERSTVIVDFSRWEGGVTPTTPVAGLPAALRTLLTLQWAGVKRIVLLCGEHEDTIRKLVARRPLNVELEYCETAPQGALLRGDALYLREDLKRAVASGGLQNLEPHILYTSRAGVRSAKELLWSQLRKPIENDGVVAYYLGRPVSRLLSRPLIWCPLTPNHITLISLLFAVLGAITVSFPGTLALGAALYWISFVFDCVDGEFARLKFMGSRFGQWLDTVADDFGTTLFSAGLGIALYRITGGSLYLVLGLGSALLYLLSSLLVYRVLNMTGVIDTAQYPYFFMGEGGAAAQEKGVFTYLAYLFRRDVVLSVHLVLALLGYYSAMFWMQFNLNIGMNLITLTDQAYRVVTGTWPNQEGPK